MPGLSRLKKEELVRLMEKYNIPFTRDMKVEDMKNLLYNADPVMPGESSTGPRSRRTTRTEANLPTTSPEGDQGEEIEVDLTEGESLMREAERVAANWSAGERVNMLQVLQEMENQ